MIEFSYAEHSFNSIKMLMTDCQYQDSVLLFFPATGYVHPFNCVIEILHKVNRTSCKQYFAHGSKETTLILLQNRQYMFITNRCPII